jgi:hypothetical protein
VGGRIVDGKTDERGDPARLGRQEKQQPDDPLQEERRNGCPADPAALPSPSRRRLEASPHPTI